MRAIGIIAALLVSASAAAVEKPLPFDKPAAVNGLAVTPTEQGASVHRFGSGVQVERPGQPAASVRPFGSGVIVSEPGKPSVVCSRFGSGTLCR